MVRMFYVSTDVPCFKSKVEPPVLSVWNENNETQIISHASDVWVVPVSQGSSRGEKGWTNWKGRIDKHTVSFTDQINQLHFVARTRMRTGASKVCVD